MDVSLEMLLVKILFSLANIFISIFIGLILREKNLENLSKRSSHIKIYIDYSKIDKTSKIEECP